MSLRRSYFLAGALLTALPFSAVAQRTTTKPAPKTTAPAPVQAAPAKQETAVDWDTLTPDNEEFSILMPKGAATETGPFEYHKFTLNTRLYMSAPASGPVVGVVSMSGIKSNPASASDLERFNSYADAFKTFFSPKVKKDVPPKMYLTTTKPFHGYTARVYKLMIGDLSGTVNAVITRKRFYAVAILNTKKDDALEDKFLSSFVIPDKPMDQPKVAANEEGPQQQEIASSNDVPERTIQGRKPLVASGGDGSINTSGTTIRSNASNEDNTEFGTGTAQATNDQGTQNQGQGNQKRPPIQGGVLNGKAIYLPAPEIPVGEKAGGVVMVQVLVDEAGNVIDARPVSGPSGLFAAAVNAARFARFSPTLMGGEPVRVQGTIAYNFARAN
ncbi:MAG TPA: energy transducer TonB [Pyrinomonadaceae bacterium]